MMAVQALTAVGPCSALRPRPAGRERA